MLRVEDLADVLKLTSHVEVDQFMTLEYLTFICYRKCFSYPQLLPFLFVTKATGGPIPNPSFFIPKLKLSNFCICPP
jgi:hypothetical protein